MWHAAMTRWRSCSIWGLCIVRRNSGWPTRKLCSSACVSSWKFDSMRNSSTARGVRFCASSTMSSARLPCWLIDTRKASSERRRSDFSMSLVRRPNDDATRRNVSSASICVLTRFPAITCCGSSLSRRLRTIVVLPATHVSGDHDEAFVLVQPVFEIRHGPPVLAAAEVESRVRVELEGLSGQSVKGLVHAAT